MTPAELLSAVIGGEASRIDELRRLSQTALLEAGKELGGNLRLGRRTTLTVLRAWQSGALTAEQVRRWAHFMFAGAFRQSFPSGDSFAFTPETQPLDIDYSDDEAVVEVVFRLKDLGDEIDGVITEQERDGMIALLGAKLP